MPSWNIHTGLAERLARSGNLDQYGVRDFNSYLFGNLVPDVYVGYMVPDVGHTLRYVDTHYGQPIAIPVPEADTFWNTWIEPAIATGGVSDVILGAWAHLLADHHFNARVRDFNEAHGVPSGDATRIKKQSDFDLFGSGLGIKSVVKPTPELYRQAADFPQYAIEAADVDAAIRADAAIVKKSNEQPEHTDYQLLSQEFIESVFEEIDADTQAGLKNYAARVRQAGFDPLAPAPLWQGRKAHLKQGPEPAILLSKFTQAMAAENTQKLEATLKEYGQRTDTPQA